jgi:hypothetical protein
MDWPAYLRALEGALPQTDKDLPADDPLLCHEAVQQLAMTAAQAYLILFTQDPRYPQLVTFTNPAIVSATNPDFTYLFAALDGTGTYRLSGTRGSSLFVQIVQNTGMIGLHDVPGPPVSLLDLDSVDIGADGSFSVLISPQPHADFDGVWWPLDLRTTSITIRQAAYDWSGERDGRFAIECLDKWPPPVRPTVEVLAQHLEGIAQFTMRYMRSLRSLRHVLQEQPVNTLSLNSWHQFGGLGHQHYYQGRFELAPDEALIVETEIPQRVRYWGIATLDELFNAIDWVNNQSSLNGFQVSLDSDGRFRGVLCVDDPGVPNWLDPAGRTRGVLQGRWLESSSAPLPTLTRVKLRNLRDHLPRDTPFVSVEQRDLALRARRKGAQYRRKW